MPNQNQVRNYQNQNGQNGQFNQQGGRRNGRGRRGNNGNGGNGGNYANNGSTHPSDLVDIPATSFMPVVYNDISARNIFVKGSQRGYTDVPDPNAGRDQGPRQRPLVFDGASLTDGAMVAYIEDTAVSDVRTFKVGDMLPQGKITRIDLTELDLTVNGKTTTIYGGQTLTGDNAFSSLYNNPVVTAPSATVLPPTLPSGDDIIARMQQRRMLELQAATNPSIRPQ